MARVQTGEILSMKKDRVNLTIGIPDVLYAQMKGEVEDRKLSVLNYSLGDLVREAIRFYLEFDHSNTVTNQMPENVFVTGMSTQSNGPLFPPADAPFGKSVTDFLQAKSKPQTKDWQLIYKDMAAMEPEEAEREFKKATSGLRLPPGFRRMPTQKQVQWLEENAG